MTVQEIAEQQLLALAPSKRVKFLDLFYAFLKGKPMQTVRIGKAKVDVTVRGCIDCSAEVSSGWDIVQKVSVTIGGKHLTVDIHRCADCSKKRRAK